MTLTRGFRSAARNCLHHAGRAATAAGVILAVSAALAAGPALAAARAPAQAHAAASPSPSASPSPARVKYYVVPRARHGQPPVTLYAIALTTLGNGSRFQEIFDLNKGRAQPNGGRLEDPQSIHAGWVLQLPPDASGPGVHIGRLPGTGKKHHAQASPSPSAQPTVPAAPGSSGFSMNTMLLLGGFLAVFACGVAVEVARRRRAVVDGRPSRPSRDGASGGSRRRAGHARAGRPRTGLVGPGPASPLAAAAAAAPLARLPVRNRGRQGPSPADPPSWPGDGPAGGWTEDHPSLPGGYPGRPSGGPPAGWLDGQPAVPASGSPWPDDHPSMPGSGPPAA